jgi:hypothetical protein
MGRRSEIRRILPEEIISEDSERNRDNSGNPPHTSLSGEQPSTSHLDVQSQLTSQTTIKYI